MEGEGAYLTDWIGAIGEGALPTDWICACVCAHERRRELGRA